MSWSVRAIGLVLVIGIIYTANAEPCKLKAPPGHLITNQIIKDAIKSGLITREEGVSLEKSIQEGRQDIVPVDTDEGIIAIGVITYEDEDLEDGEFIDGDWYDAYH
jgi:uncharacterized protein (UPF0218 family)